MKTIMYVGLMLIAFAFIGCSGNYGKLKTQSEKETKATQQELIDNWSNYKISLDYRETSGLPLAIDLDTLFSQITISIRVAETNSLPIPMASLTHPTPMVKVLD